jgi:large subunit ribosomal protein L22
MNLKHKPKLKTISQRALKKVKEKAETYTVSASARMIRMSPLKIRRVLKQIVGCSYEEALILLRFLPYRACHPIAKLIKSAGSNVLKNKFIPESYLQVVEAHVDKGPILKRIRPRAKGRAYPIKKYTSHISVSLRSKFSRYENDFNDNFIAYSIDEKLSKWKDS